MVIEDQINGSAIVFAINILQKIFENTRTARETRKGKICCNLYEFDGLGDQSMRQ